MGNNLSLSITADVFDLQAKRAVMSAEFKQATKDLNDFAKQAAAGGGTEELRAGMLASAEAAETARGKILALNKEIKELSVQPSHAGGVFEGIMASVSEAGVRVRETIGVIGEMREAVMAATEAMIAAFAIERIGEWGREIGEAAEKIQHTGTIFGMTTAEVQQLNAELDLLGIPADAATTSFQKLDKALLTARSGNKEMSATFRQLGVDISAPMSQLDLFHRTIEGLSGIEDVPTRIGVAMQVLGRNIQQIAPMIGVTKEQMAEANQKIEEYGIKSQEAQVAGMALAEAFNEHKVAMQGLTNTMVQEFGPGIAQAVNGLDALIRDFIESYKEGGVAKEIFQALGETCRALSVIVVGFGGAVVVAFDALRSLWNVASALVIPVLEAVGVAVAVTAKAIEMAGRVMYDAFRLDWGGIRTDFASGLNSLTSMAYEAGQNMKAALAAGMGAAGESWKSTVGAWNATGAAIHTLAGGAGHRGGEAEGEGGDAARRSFDPTVGHEKKGKHGPSVAQQLQEELEAKKVAWAAAQDAQETYQQYSLQSEADFWAQALKRTDLSAKDRLDVERNYLAARQQLLKERQAQEQADAKQSEALALEAAKTEIDLSRNALNAKMDALQRQRQLGQITAQQELTEKAALNTQLLQLDIDLENKQFEIRLKALQAERAILGETPAYYRRINDQIELLTRQHSDKVVLMNAAADRQMTKDNAAVAQAQRNVLQQSYQGFAQQFAKLVTLQQGFMSTVRGMWGNFVGIVEQATARMVTLWITSLGQKEAAEKASSLVSIGHSAKQAAAGAYASVVKIPIVGPILAPIAAAVAFAGTMAFASAEDGWDVPGAAGPGIDGRGGMPAIIHPREMVLPADLASAVRDMASLRIAVPAFDFGRFQLPEPNIAPLRSTPSASAGAADFGSTQRGGDTHVHFNVNAIDARGVRKFLVDNQMHVVEAVKKGVRNGAR